MGEIKKLKLTTENDSKDIEIEINLDNIDTVLNILDHEYEEGEKPFYIDYTKDYIDDNFDALCNIILEYVNSFIKEGDKIFGSTVEHRYKDKIEKYFELIQEDIADDDIYEKFINTLTNRLKEKYKFPEDSKYFLIGTSSPASNLFLDINEIKKILLDQEKNKQYMDQKINIQNKDPKEITVENFEHLIEEVKSIDDVRNFIELFKQSNLKGNKDILKFAFEKRGPAFLKPLLNDKDINWELNENNIEDLFICACKNTCSDPKQVIKYFFDKFSGKIDINNPYKKMNYQKDETLLDDIIEKNNSLEEDNLVEILIRKLDLENLKLINGENKLKVLFLSIIYNGDIDLFKDYYNSAITTIKKLFNDEKECEKAINNCRHKCIKQFYVEGNSNTIEALKFIKMDKENLSKLLNDLILIDILDVELFNKILNSAENDFGYPTNLNNVEVIGQGKSQIKIKNRIIEYSDDTKKIVSCVKDEVFSNLKDGSEYKLYEVTYDNKGNQEIIYYEKNKNTKLAIIEIDKDGKLEFKSGKDGEKVSYNLAEINEILSDNYVDINGFDNKLSFLRYASIRNMENVNFKLNCKTAKDIVDIANESKDEQEKDKVFICNLDVYKHNVQVAIINGEVTILNTGENIDSIKTEIENSLNIKIKQIRTINQSHDNCNEASKLYMATLAIKCNQHSLNLKTLFERLNKFEEFMENTLNIKDEEAQIKYLKEEYNKGSTKEENIKMIKTILETNIELLEKHKKHFLKMSNNLKSFYNIVTKIDSTLNNETKKMYNIINIIGLGNEINYLQSEKNNNNRYKKFTEDVVKFYKINLDKEEKDKSLADKLNKGEELLKFIEMCICYSNEQSNKQQPNKQQLNKQQKQIFENINKKIDSEGESVFEECLEEFSKLQPSEIKF